MKGELLLPSVEALLVRKRILLQNPRYCLVGIGTTVASQCLSTPLRVSLALHVDTVDRDEQVLTEVGAHHTWMWSCLFACSGGGGGGGGEEHPHSHLSFLNVLEGKQQNLLTQCLPKSLVRL